MFLELLFFVIIGLCTAKDETVLMTEVFEIVVDPPLFNWTYDEMNDQFVYQPSLVDAPDLPSWMNFVYSERHKMGYLYGVPPLEHRGNVAIQIVALNKKNYETRHEKINLIVTEKLNPAKYEVHMKIDNVNVEDMFDVERMEALKEIFRKNLWKESENDLYITFLKSALQLGARKPLNPNEGEGVVVRVGSQAKFSNELIELQNEVKPLWKVPTCPRDFKRTSVERLFRDSNFALDWCAFRLIDNEKLPVVSVNEKFLNIMDDNYDDHWQTYLKSEIPERSYSSEITLTVVLPILFMVMLGSFLSFILCFHHEGVRDEASEEFLNNIFHICTDYYLRSRDMEDFSSSDIHNFETIQQTADSLRNLTSLRDSSLSPDPVILSRSHTNSPTSTISRGVHCRPSPPPYVRPKFKPDL